MSSTIIDDHVANERKEPVFRLLCFQCVKFKSDIIFAGGKKGQLICMHAVRC